MCYFLGALECTLYGRVSPQVSGRKCQFPGFFDDRHFLSRPPAGHGDDPPLGGEYRVFHDCGGPGRAGTGGAGWRLVGVRGCPDGGRFRPGGFAAAGGPVGSAWVVAHDALGMLFRSADLDTGIAFHAKAVMDLAPHLDSADCVRLAHPLIHAWRNLAEVLAGHGQPKQALALLRGAPAALPRVPDVAKELSTEVARYEMIGHPAPKITAPYWFGAPA